MTVDHVRQIERPGHETASAVALDNYTAVMDKLMTPDDFVWDEDRLQLAP